MTPDETAVEKANRLFFDAIEAMISGQGLALMREAWHHSSSVTSKHPITQWAHGWDEVSTIWEASAAFGRADRGGSRLAMSTIRVHGDIAYVACVLETAPAWGGESLSCTNILSRIDGNWRLVHHHIDAGPGMVAALERMLKE
jgi:ketosteroid isomerase-like protein